MVRTIASGRVWASVRSLGACAVLAAALAGPAGAGIPDSQPTTAPRPAPVTPQAVAGSVAKAVGYLNSCQQPQGTFPNPHSTEYVGGGEALAAWALLDAGQSPDEPRVKRTLEYLKGLQPAHTYTRSLRTIVYALLADDPDCRKRLTEDARWLVKEQQRTGGWGYGPGSAMTRLRPDWTDASNSQLALLALRDAAEAGVLVPEEVWRLAEAYWRRLQNADGGWGYQAEIAGQRPQRPESHGSMTAAGVATYYILTDRLARPGDDRPGRGPRRSPGAFSDRMDPGLAWLASHYAVDKVPQYVWMMQAGQLYYYLLLLQRVGNAGGLRALGGNDYDTDIAALLLVQQKPNGSWNDSVIDTSFALLTLRQAQAPVALGRWQVEDAPGPIPRDAAGAVRFLSRALRRPVAWRKVEPDAAQAIFDAPAVLLDVPAQGELAAPAAETLRRYVRAGGTVIAVAPPGGSGLATLFCTWCLNLLPDYHAENLPPEHPVFALRFPIDLEKRPAVTAIGDGCRMRIFIIPDDVAGDWSGGPGGSPEALQLAGNLLLYAAGGDMPADRWSARRREPPAPPARRFIPIARLKYDGDYTTCPLAIPRLSDALSGSLSVGLSEQPPADPVRAIDPALPVLYLTGNVPPVLPPGQQDNLRRYLEGGGTLLIDPAVGRGEFVSAAAAMVGQMLGTGALHPLEASSPLVTGHFAGGLGADLRSVRLLRAPTTQPVQPGPPKLSVAFVNNRPAVVLSQYGLACSIEGTPCVENVGYVTADARKIALNVILNAVSGRP